MERDVKQPDYLGHRQRLRQRFLLGEGKDMADYELLELVLTMAIPRRDVKPLAKKLIAEFNDFSGVINAPAAALLEVDGVKENTLAMLKVIKAARHPYFLADAVRGRSAGHPLSRYVARILPYLHVPF